ncbi:MAG: Fmu (Sun) domain-containing protein [Chitinophagales bacterium]
MSRCHSYLNSAKTILQQYHGEEPLASFLKKFFSLQKKYGSKDRKTISHLCYCFFRLGKGGDKLSMEERLILALFLCSTQQNEVLLELKPEWNQQVELSLKQKLAITENAGLITDVFPWRDELSNGIDPIKLSESFFVQPDLFLRLRPGKEEIVKVKLQSAGINFNVISDSCVALSNSTRIDSVIELNKEAVIQDYSSQRVGELFHLVRPGQPVPILRESDQVWDCCAASGGKSIMLYDLYPNIDLTVSDIRESIIINLKKRFKEADITKYKSIVGDVTDPGSRLQTSEFRLILADVPCTGSGTWSRTPEQLYYFEKEKINEYASLQRKIISNVIPHLKHGGFLLYITCSVFKKENEEIVEFMKQNFHLQLIKMEVLKGYDEKADTMFAALVQKSSEP